MINPDRLINLIVTLVILLSFIFIIYTKLKKQSLTDTLKEVKELMGVGASGIRKR